jgi:hypothetical protein
VFPGGAAAPFDIAVGTGALLPARARPRPTARPRHAPFVPAAAFAPVAVTRIVNNGAATLPGAAGGPGRESIRHGPAEPW